MDVEVDRKLKAGGSAAEAPGKKAAKIDAAVAVHGLPPQELSAEDVKMPSEAEKEEEEAEELLEAGDGEKVPSWAQQLF